METDINGGFIMKKFNCPVCNKELIRLEPFEKGIYNFWCDHCNIDIVITKNNEVEDFKDNINGGKYATI